MVLNRLTNEIFSHLVYSNVVKEQGKAVSIDRQSGKEIVLFFKIDGGYINDGSPRADFLCYYYNIESQQKEIVIIELKGRDIRHAVGQLESTITHSKMQPLLKRFNGIKRALIVTDRAAPHDIIRKEKPKFQRKFGVLLEIKHKKKVSLRDILV